MARPIIIDCDPGQDDALMLFLALASPEELDILGIVAVAGNVGAEKTQRNVRIICELADRTDVPVYLGHSGPMKGKTQSAEFVHGQEGIDGFDLFEPKMELKSEHGVDFIIKTLMAADDESITLVPTGPLTNIAHAIMRERNILPKIREIVLMGGAFREGGNATPSAEYNIFADPHAARIVFECGRPIVDIGLDATHKVVTSPDILKRIKALGSKVALASHGMLTFYARYDSEKFGVDGAPLHDPCTIAYLLKPELFKLKPCNVRIETESELTIGHTAVDFWNTTGLPANVQWTYDADRDGFFELLVERLGRYQ